MSVKGVVRSVIDELWNLPKTYLDTNSPHQLSPESRRVIVSGMICAIAIILLYDWSRRKCLEKKRSAKQIPSPQPKSKTSFQAKSKTKVKTKSQLTGLEESKKELVEVAASPQPGVAAPALKRPYPMPSLQQLLSETADDDADDADVESNGGGENERSFRDDLSQTAGEVHRSMINAVGYCEMGTGINPRAEVIAYKPKASVGPRFLDVESNGCGENERSFRRDDLSQTAGEVHRSRINFGVIVTPSVSDVEQADPDIQEGHSESPIQVVDSHEMSEDNDNINEDGNSSDSEEVEGRVKKSSVKMEKDNEILDEDSDGEFLSRDILNQHQDSRERDNGEEEDGFQVISKPVDSQSNVLALSLF